MSEGVDDEVVRARARVGQVLREKWTLDRLLGVGGMGAVYAATHRNQKRGALKILHAELSGEVNIRQRFLREGYVANSVGHQGAVEVFDDDIAEDGSAYLVMELLEGEVLEARWERKGHKLPELETLALTDQLLDTLAAAHRKGIVHRDLKPENLFLQRSGALKVLDFGIARLKEGGKGATATQTGNAMGTPAFMAPEQARGRWEEVDGRTDLWAVGASLFTLLSGHYVHGQGTANEVMARAITQPPPSLRTVLDGADPALVAFVDKALAYKPADRFQSAEEMQTELRSLYHSLDSRAGAPMRQVQPSIEDVGPIASGDAATPIEASGATAKETLTTGRAVVSVSDGSPERLPAPQKPKWLAPAAAAAGLLGLVIVFVATRNNSAEDVRPAATAADTPAAATLAVQPVGPTPSSVLARDAPAPEPQTVDLNSLPTLKSAAAAGPSQGPAKLSPPVALLNAIDPARGPQKPLAAKSAVPPPTKPPASIFKSRQ